MVAAAVIGAAVVGGAVQADSAHKASKAQTKAANQSIDFQKESRDIALELQRPQREAGYAATAALMDLTGLSRGKGGTGTAISSATTAPNLADYPTYKFQADPGYQFRLDEGNRALERGAAARGGLLSGGFARKAIRYAQDYASNEYQKVYDRIATIAGFGSSASSQGATTVVNTGTNVGNALTNAGEARASGYVAQGNAWSTAINQIAGAYGSGMFGSGGGGGGGSSLYYDGSGYAYNLPN